MQLRPALRLAVLAALCAVVLLPLVDPVAALDEARVLSASCDAVRVRQTGVPPGTAVVLVAVDAVRGGDVGSVRSTAGRDGVVEVTVPARLVDVARIVVEVERTSDQVEIGEAATDLPQPCSRRATPAPALPRASVGATQTSASSATAAAHVVAPSTGHKPLHPTRVGGSWAWAVAIGTAALGLAAALVVRRRRPVEVTGR